MVAAPLADLGFGPDVFARPARWPSSVTDVRKVWDCRG